MAISGSNREDLANNNHNIVEVASQSEILVKESSPLNRGSIKDSTDSNLNFFDVASQSKILVKESSPQNRGSIKDSTDSNLNFFDVASQSKILVKESSPQNRGSIKARARAGSDEIKRQAQMRSTSCPSNGGFGFAEAIDVPTFSSDGSGRCLSLLQRRRGLGKAKGLKIDLKTVSADNSGEEKSAKISDMYNEFEVLGQGSMGVVRRAERKSDGEEVALKIVRTVDEEQIDIARKEFMLLQQIKHPHIVRAIDFFVTSDRAVLVLSHFPGSTLQSAVRHMPGRRLPELMSRRLFLALMQALSYLHKQRIVHRDVKPQNVLISSDFSDLRLIDFNIARYVPDGIALSPQCTPLYASPEVRMGSSPSESGDIWGAGLCLCLMVSGRCHYEDIKTGDIFSMLPMVSEECKLTLRQCLTIHQSLRPDAMTLLQGAWLQCGPATYESLAGNSSPLARWQDVLRKRSLSVSSDESTDQSVLSNSEVSTCFLTTFRLDS